MLSEYLCFLCVPVRWQYVEGGGGGGAYISVVSDPSHCDWHLLLS